MTRSDVVHRRATAADAAAVAALHADSWQRHYRGAYSDEFLDGPVIEDRLWAWTERLGRPTSGCTILAESGGELIGFAHTVFHEGHEWGALLDNLHVTYEQKRSGVGRGLMAQTAAAVIDDDPGSPLHLWVLEQNVAAQAFYRAMGGEVVGSKVSEAQGGGEITALRVVWRDPRLLLG